MRAVAGIDLEIAPGETVALLGPNGAGKSTTIEMLLGLTRPDAGTVSVFGLAPEAAVDAGGVAAMLQTGSLIRDLSVRELVTMIASLYREPLPVDEALELAGIAGLSGRRTQKLSGGETQRVRFAIAIVCRPRPARARRADGRDGRREPTRVLGCDARLRRPGEDRRVRDALPRRGGRVRRPRRADGHRRDRRRRAADRDQGDGRVAHDPRDASGRRPRDARGTARRDGRRAPRGGRSC